MRSILEKKISIKLIFTLFIIILTILTSGHAIITGNTRVILICNIGVTLLAFLIQRDLGFLQEIKAIIVLLLVLSLVGSMLINNDTASYMSYMQMFFYILSAYLITRVYDARQIFTLFVKLMRFVAYVSVVIYILNFGVGIVALFPIVENGYGVLYYTIGLINYSAETISYTARLSGPFWEPGVYAAFLALSFIAEFYLDKKISIKRMLIYIITLFLCGSTAGYFYIAIIGGVFIAQKKDRIYWLKIIVLAGVIATVFINWDNILSMLVEWRPDTFEKIALRNDSFNARVYSFQSDFSIMLDNILGCGMGRYESLSDNKFLIEYGLIRGSLTSTCTWVGAQFGIAFFVIYNGLWLRNLFCVKEISLPARILVVSLFLLLMSFNPLYVNQFIWIFLFADFKVLNNENEGDEVSNENIAT